MKDMPMETTKMEPSINIDSDHIDNIGDFSLEDSVNITIRGGKVVGLDTYGEGKSKRQSLRIQYSKIQVEEGTDSEDEPGKAEKSPGKKSMADLLSSKMSK